MDSPIWSRLPPEILERVLLFSPPSDLLTMMLLSSRYYNFFKANVMKLRRYEGSATLSWRTSTGISNLTTLRVRLKCSHYREFTFVRRRIRSAVRDSKTGRHEILSQCVLPNFSLVHLLRVVLRRVVLKTLHINFFTNAAPVLRLLATSQDLHIEELSCHHSGFGNASTTGETVREPLIGALKSLHCSALTLHIGDTAFYNVARENFFNRPEIRTLNRLNILVGLQPMSWDNDFILSTRMSSLSLKYGNRVGGGTEAPTPEVVPAWIRQWLRGERPEAEDVVLHFNRSADELIRIVFDERLPWVPDSNCAFDLRLGFTKKLVGADGKTLKVTVTRDSKIICAVRNQ